jgi:hypothetical protein
MSNGATTGRLVFLLAMLMLMLMSIATACATSDTPSAQPADATPAPVAAKGPERIGDLVKVDIGSDGELFIREDHQIGGFDAVHFPMARLRYEPGSPTLSKSVENEFLGLLEQALIDSAESGGFEVAERSGRCVLRIQVAIEDVNITQRNRTATAGDWATLTFAIELRESLSGRALARYSKRERIMSPGTGEDRAELILANYAAILEGIDLPGMVTGVTATPSPARENCEGSIARIARGEQG